MNSISHKWISCSFYYPRTYELCPALKPTVSIGENVNVFSDNISAIRAETLSASSVLSSMSALTVLDS